MTNEDAHRCASARVVRLRSDGVGALRSGWRDALLTGAVAAIAMRLAARLLSSLTSGVLVRAVTATTTALGVGLATCKGSANCACAPYGSVAALHSTRALSVACASTRQPGGSVPNCSVAGATALTSISTDGDCTGVTPHQTFARRTDSVEASTPSVAARSVRATQLLP